MIPPADLENTESKVSFRARLTVSVGLNQVEVFVSHLGDDIQQAIVYMNLKLLRRGQD